MIIFIYGTTAEAIKIAPVARRLTQLGVPYQQWVTRQHTESLDRAIPELGLREPDRYIANGWRGKPLKTPLQMLGWLADVMRWSARNYRLLRRETPEGSLVVVHGDTMTTVMGTFIGRFIGAPVAHIEAGLRSGNWRHPFPEELDRRIVGRFANIHYAPSDEAARNLAGRADVINTLGNTAKDAVSDVASGDISRRIGEPTYGLVLLHRYEFISNQAMVRETLETLQANSRVPLRIVVDSFSGGAVALAVEELGLTRFTLMTKLEHGEFVATMQQAEFVITDSGGIQQEAAALGVPTLIHRKVTEGREGFGSSAVLSGWDFAVVEAFLGNYERYRRHAPSDEPSPSDIIVADLVARGYARPS